MDWHSFRKPDTGNHGNENHDHGNQPTYYGMAIQNYKALDTIYVFCIFIFGILGLLISILLLRIHVWRDFDKKKKPSILNTLYTHFSVNNTIKSIIAVLYSMLVLQSNWVYPIYYKYPNRTSTVMKKQNMNSYVYCNIIGPLHEATIVQGVMLLLFLCCFQVINRYYPRLSFFLSRKRYISHGIIAVGWIISNRYRDNQVNGIYHDKLPWYLSKNNFSILGAICTFMVDEAFYMDNSSGFCYTTENSKLPGVGIFFFALPPLLSFGLIVILLAVLCYQHYKDHRDKERKKKRKAASQSNKMMVVIVCTMIFVLCEFQLWLVYFIHHIREGLNSKETGDYYYGLFYHKYLHKVLHDDFGYTGKTLHMALMYYPMYVQLKLAMETFLQSTTILVIQDNVREMFWNRIMTSRRFNR